MNSSKLSGKEEPDAQNKMNHDIVDPKTNGLKYNNQPNSPATISLDIDRIVPNNCVKSSNQNKTEQIIPEIIYISDQTVTVIKEAKTGSLGIKPAQCTKITIDENSNELNSASSLMCRICHCEETSEEYLITPCYCSGTLRFVHQSCLQQWLKSNGKILEFYFFLRFCQPKSIKLTKGMKSCELCKFDFIMQTKIRSLKNWEKLDMNNIERRKVLCAVTFHIIAITCVIWSLYVLIERTSEEIKLGRLDWAFWIKLIVVAIGFTGGVVFMYIQCKMYFQLCLRWRLYNRVIIIQPITEEYIKNSKKKYSERQQQQQQLNAANGEDTSFLLLGKAANNSSVKSSKVRATSKEAAPVALATIEMLPSLAVNSETTNDNPDIVLNLITNTNS